ncbi:MAG: tripartite tricarboxylate transporter permease [Spirochaetales bacterium]|nr:tripartite tricarboxylate transporter permease [Spirochaetales bacterium]
MTVGCALGTVFGCIPGLSTPIALALVLPLIFKTDVHLAICLMMGIYCGGVSGGLVSAIMLKIPGSSAAVATTFDGYPMAQRGEGARAMSIGVFASFFGGTVSTIFLMLLANPLAHIALGFGPWEYFGTALMALILAVFLMKGDPLKSLITACIGVLLTTVGISPIDGVAERFTFGSVHLKNGFQMIALVIGVFALPEVLKNAGRIKNIKPAVKLEKKRFYLISWSDLKELFTTMVRGSILGTIVGILPGLGGGPACLMGYAMEKRFSKEPETFGTGNPHGIAAPESANNATVGGALIPMLSLGVPGDTNTSIILGAFTLLGIATGPIMVQNTPEVFTTTILAVFVANFVMLILQSFSIPYLVKMLSVSNIYLLPIITVFCVTGCISLNNNTFEVYYMMVLLFIGYLLESNDYPVAPLIIGFVLGGTVETNLRRSIMYYGSFTNCLSKVSIGTLFFGVSIIIPIIYLILGIKNARDAKKAS